MATSDMYEEDGIKSNEVYECIYNDILYNGFLSQGVNQVKSLALQGAWGKSFDIGFINQQNYRYDSILEYAKFLRIIKRIDINVEVLTGNKVKANPICEIKGFKTQQSNQLVDGIISLHYYSTGNCIKAEITLGKQYPIQEMKEYRWFDYCSII